MAAYLHLAVSESQQPKALSIDVHCRPGTWKFLQMLLDLAVSESQRQGLSMDLHCYPGNVNFYQCSYTLLSLKVKDKDSVWRNIAVSESQRQGLGMEVHYRPSTCKFLPMLIFLAVSDSQRHGLIG